MHIITLFSLLATIFSFSLALIVLNKNIHKSPNRVFGLFCICAALWSFIEFLARQSETAQRATFWFDLGAIWTFVIAFFFHFVLEYTNYKRKKEFKILLYITHCLAAVFAFYDLFLIENPALWYSWGWSYLIPRSYAFIIISSWGVVISLTSFCILTHFYFNLKEKKIKTQTLLILAGFGIAAFAGIMCEWLLPVFFTKIPEFTKMSIFLMTVFISYAIWRHNLFDLHPADAADVIIETMSDALIVVNTRDEIVIVNKSLLAMLQYTAEDLLGKNSNTLLSYPVGINASIEQLLKSEKANDIHSAFIRKDGSLIPVSLSWSLLRHKNNMLRGIILIGRDISESQKALENLHQARMDLENRVEKRTQELEQRNKDLAAQKEYFAVTLRSIGDGVITIDGQQSVVFLNKAAEAITGWKQQDAIGKKLNLVFQTKPVEQDSTQAEFLNREIELQSFSGIHHKLSESRSTILDVNGKAIGYVIVFRDITEKEILEEELFRAKKLESVSLLASGLAHDFNNLLTSIITNLFMAKTGLQMQGDTYTMITNAEKAAFRASSLSKQLLSFARDNGTFNQQNSSLKELIEESVGFYLSGSKCEYRLDLEEDLFTAYIDRGQIDQVLNNIIVNADQSMPNGGIITVKAKNIEFQKNPNIPLKPGKYICISITDEGTGIKPENLDRIFDPYFTTRQHGNGLGLSSAYTIIQKHKGHISVQSEVNKGSTFDIFLPASETMYSKNSADSSNSGREKVLVLDDEDIIRLSTERLLSHLGYKVFTASEGNQVLQMYNAAIENGTPFDAAILDLTVSGGKGAREIIDELRIIDPNTKVIVSSGYPNDPVMTGFETFGFCAAISKPYNIDELSCLLKRVLIPKG